MMINARFRRRAPALTGVLALVSVTVVTAQQPQPPTSGRKFEAASVKPGLSPAELGRKMALSGGGAGVAMPAFGVRTLPSGRLQGTATLKQLIGRAFDVKDYQIDGGPAWLATDYFEIAATAGGDATQAEFSEMLRALLVERFRLRSHMETRDAPVYVLTLARSDGRLGSGLKPTTPECEKQIAEKGTPPRPPGGPPTAPVCGMTMMMGRPAGSTLMGGGFPITQLAAWLSGELSGHVVDRTGLTGRFDITLEYLSQRQGIAPPAIDAAGGDTPFPPVPEAVQRQLGLKIDKEVGPLPVLVVDEAKPPTPD